MLALKEQQNLNNNHHRACANERERKREREIEPVGSTLKLARRLSGFTRHRVWPPPMLFAGPQASIRLHDGAAEPTGEPNKQGTNAKLHNLNTRKIRYDDDDEEELPSSGSCVDVACRRHGLMDQCQPEKKTTTTKIARLFLFVGLPVLGRPQSPATRRAAMIFPNYSNVVNYHHHTLTTHSLKCRRLSSIPTSPEALHLCEYRTQTHTQTSPCHRLPY